MKKFHFLVIVAVILAISFSGCVSDNDQKTLSSKSFDWTEKCLTETEVILRSSGLYGLKPKNVGDIIKWTDKESSDLFHQQIRNFRDSVPPGLDINNVSHQNIIARKFGIIFEELYSRNCKYFALPLISSELQVLAAQNFDIDLFKIESSRLFFLSIVYGQVQITRPSKK